MFWFRSHKDEMERMDEWQVTENKFVNDKYVEFYSSTAAPGN